MRNSWFFFFFLLNWRTDGRRRKKKLVTHHHRRVKQKTVSPGAESPSPSTSIFLATPSIEITNTLTYGRATSSRRRFGLGIYIIYEKQIDDWSQIDNDYKAYTNRYFPLCTKQCWAVSALFISRMPDFPVQTAGRLMKTANNRWHWLQRSIKNM